MALRKIFIAVDCQDDAERDEVQHVMEQISAMRLLKGNAIIGMYPYLKAHQNELMQLFKMVKDNGVKSLLSVNGGIILSKLARQ
jgi:hypothetical protein